MQETARSYQTARLSRGRHKSPRDGVCAMELASMLAGERFSDHPRCVSPAVAAFVRVYNDLVDDGRRADLYAYAAAVVGSRGKRGDEIERAKAQLRWMIDELGCAPFEVKALAVGLRTGRGRKLIAEHTARYAASSRARHDAALRLLDGLLGADCAPLSIEPEPAPAREPELVEAL